MQLLSEIYEKDFGIISEENKDIQYKIRKAARAVIFNDKNEIAIFNVANEGYHKLPGGGIEKEETIKEALNREALEETGCEIEITSELGIIIEYRNQLNILQINYCYIAKAKTFGEPSFTEKEKSNGFKLEWMSLDEAMKIAKKDNLKIYLAKFIIKRDLIFLEEVKKFKVGLKINNS